MDGEPRPFCNKMSSMNADGYTELSVVHRTYRIKRIVLIHTRYVLIVKLFIFITKDYNHYYWQ